MADLPRQGEVMQRDRVLPDAELALVWKASDEGLFGPFFRLLILTGARRDEIGALRWSEIKGDTIEMEGGRTKNGEPHTIPLAPVAAALIDALPRIAKSEFVFTTTVKTPVSGWSKAKATLDRAVTKLNGGKAIEPWRIHDLRRTMATGLQRLGVNLQVIEAILGHISGSRAGIVGIYQRHQFDSEKRQALNRWAQHIGTLTGDKPAKVVPMRRRVSP